MALAVNVRSRPSTTVLFPIDASTGALLLSVTVTMIVSKALRAGEPLSATRTVMELVLGPWASVGVQVKRPEFGLMEAPVGAPASRE